MKSQKQDRLFRKQFVQFPPFIRLSWSKNQVDLYLGIFRSFI